MVNEKALLSSEELINTLGARKDGLTEEEAQEKLKDYGYNEITQKKDFFLIKILVSQFTSILVLILIFAGTISFFLGETLDAIGIFAIVIINAGIGFFQEYKAERSVRALKKMVVNKAIVLRGGKKQKIDAKLLVPGDVVVLEEGMRVPADLKIITNFGIKADESILTGESIPARKKIIKNAGKDNYKETILFSNTLIVSGSGLGIVYATGMKTEFGKIAELVMKEEKEQTALGKEIDSIVKKLSIIIIVFLTFLFFVGVSRHIELIEIFMISVSLGVSAVPEGLPIVITLTFALGVQAIAKKKAIVRKMQAIEELGSSTVICSDKTGTLTLNEMTANRILVDGKEHEVAGIGYSSKEKISIKGKTTEKFFLVCQNCNNSFIEFDSKGKEKNVLGDPTEIALKVLSKKAGEIPELEKIFENPFTSERKMMSTIHKIGKGTEMLIKGAPEEILKKCSTIMINGEKKPFSLEEKKRIQEKANAWSAEALRVLGVAFKPINEEPQKALEEELIFLGLVGMIDPPREEVKDALSVAHQAGIGVKIITGDSLLTTKAIAKRIGLEVNGVLEGTEIDAMNDTELKKVLPTTTIFARTSPQHKYRIVSLLKETGEIVAVTGDGVNDAPALKKADIGISMGIKGTQVSKEASDIVLQDDNFSTIVKIIAEGRRIYTNIVSFIKLMLASNFDLFTETALLTLLGLPMPMLPLQILWANLVTDSLPALAISSEEAEEGIMEKKPHEKGKGILSQFTLFFVIAILFQTIINLGLFFYGLNLDAANGINTYDFSQPSHARTLVFCGIVMFDLFLAFNCRGIKKSILNGGLFNNKNLLFSVLIAFGLQFLLLYHPFMRELFKLVPLGTTEWIMLGIVSIPTILLPEIIVFTESIIEKIKAIQTKTI